MIHAAFQAHLARPAEQPDLLMDVVLDEIDGDKTRRPVSRLANPALAFEDEVNLFIAASRIPLVDGC